MKQRFTAVLEEGHKGAAVLVPFDPEKEWGTVAESIPSPAYGRVMTGHPVHGTLGGIAFSGWIGQRWGRRFILVDEALRKAAGVVPGESVEVVVEPGAREAGGARRMRKRPDAR